MFIKVHICVLLQKSNLLCRTLGVLHSNVHQKLKILKQKQLTYRQCHYILIYIYTVYSIYLCYNGESNTFKKIIINVVLNLLLLIFYYLNIILHYITLHYVTLRYVTLRCVALRCVALRYITLRHGVRQKFLPVSGCFTVRVSLRRRSSRSSIVVLLCE